MDKDQEDRIVKTMTGQLHAILVLADVMVRSKLLAGDRLIELIKESSAELFDGTDAVVRAELSHAIDDMIALLGRYARGSASGSAPKAH